jgi:hypothetical protein
MLVGTPKRLSNTFLSLWEALKAQVQARDGFRLPRFSLLGRVGFNQSKTDRRFAPVSLKKNEAINVICIIIEQYKYSKKRHRIST